MHASYYAKSDANLSRVTGHNLIQSVLQTYLNKPIFSALDNHMKECEPLDNHLILLIKAIAEKYLQVRCYYAGKQYTANLITKKQTKSRQDHTKLVLFSGL